MRRISGKENKKRGCICCDEVVKKNDRYHCPHNACPYSELNKYDSYTAYIKANSGDPMIMKYLAALDRKENLEDDESLQGIS